MEENAESELRNISDHICRICSTLSNLLIPIFEGEGIEQKLELKIQHLPIKISANDTLPLKLCYQCAQTLIAWDSLITSCLETDKKLRAIQGQDTEDEKPAVFDEVENNVDFDSDDEPLINQAKKKKLDIKAEEEMPQDRNKKSKRKKLTPKKLAKKEEERENDGRAEEGNDSSFEQCSSEYLLANIKTEVIDYEYEENADGSNEKHDVKVDTRVKCEHCNRTYKAARHLYRHIKKCHKKESESSHVQKCDVCGNIYKTKTNLKRHYINEHMKNQVQCPVCYKSINSRKLDAHLKVEHGVKTENEEEEKYPCKYCPKMFKNKYVRNSHVREAHLNEPMKCKLCGFEGIRTVVKRHKREVHCERKFPCSICGVPFKTLHTLKMHMTTHSDLRCFTCELCGMGFKRLNNVRDHMKCHEEKSNQCQICGNFFARKRYLAIHEKTIHNFYADGSVPEEKGFECGTCGAKLKWKKNLLAHMRIHTGEKPYVCKICKKDFICHGSLRTHMAKHLVCTMPDKNLELLMSPMPQSEFHTLHPQLSVEMQCY